VYQVLPRFQILPTYVALEMPAGDWELSTEFFAKMWIFHRMITVSLYFQRIIRGDEMIGEMKESGSTQVLPDFSCFKLPLKSNMNIYQKTTKYT
jgi:hypothetical protein